MWEQSPDFCLWNEFPNFWYTTKLPLALSPPDLPNLIFLPAQWHNSNRKTGEVPSPFPQSSTSLRRKHSLKRWVLWTWAVTRLRRKLSALDLSLGEPLHMLNWMVPLWWLETLKKIESGPKTSIELVVRDQLLAHIRYAQSTLIRPFCSDEFQECVGLHWNKSGNYRSFPSNKESYS